MVVPRHLRRMRLEHQLDLVQRHRLRGSFAFRVRLFRALARLALFAPLGRDGALRPFSRVLADRADARGDGTGWLRRGAAARAGRAARRQVGSGLG